MNRNPKRLELIRSLPCCECGLPPRSEAAHSNFGEHGKGKALKADDKYTIPLCRSCHGQFDQNLSQRTRQQQMDWFNRKLKFIDEVLNDQSKDENCIF